MDRCHGAAVQIESTGFWANCCVPQATQRKLRSSTDCKSMLLAKPEPTLDFIHFGQQRNCISKLDTHMCPLTLIKGMLGRNNGEVHIVRVESRCAYRSRKSRIEGPALQHKLMWILPSVISLPGWILDLELSMAGSDKYHGTDSA
jgi:hypothetical protein